MRTLLSRAALVVAVAFLAPGPATVAHAAVPEGPALLHLKDHPDLALAWTDDGAALVPEGDRWTIKPVETLVDFGAHLLVHEATGQCLSATPIATGQTTSPVELIDCAGATEWGLEYDDRATHQDFRFVTTEGHYLGVHEAEAAGGIEVLLVDVPSSRHAQEWRFSQEPDEATPPPSEPPSEPPSDESSEPPAAPPAQQPMLPQTGAGLAALGASGLAAVAAGAVLVVWWRRRSLRTQW